MRYILLAFSVVVLSGCKSSSSAGDGSPSSAWAGQMQLMAESFSTLLPITLDPIQFNEPANQELIDQELAKLGHFAHEVSTSKSKPSDDPGLEFAGKQFAG